jgi:hypothetical protein
MIDLEKLESTLDLWASLWSPRERDAVEGALSRVLAGDGRHETRLAALAACHVIATPRLLEAAARAVELDRFTAAEADAVERETLPLYRLVEHAARIRGAQEVVALLAARFLDEPRNPIAGPLLDRVDVRDLFVVAQASDDPRVRAEAERRIARRGPHQRARLARSLGVEVARLGVACERTPVADEDDYYADYRIARV